MSRLASADESKGSRDAETCVCVRVCAFECLRAGAGEAAQPTGGFPHQVHGPSVRSQGEEHVVAHILVHVHLGLREETGGQTGSERHVQVVLTSRNQ